LFWLSAKAKSLIAYLVKCKKKFSILVPPRVRANPNDGNIVVKKGSEITLECSASGNPVPTVTWSREVKQHSIFIY